MGAGINHGNLGNFVLRKNKNTHKHCAVHDKPQRVSHNERLFFMYHSIDKP